MCAAARHALHPQRRGTLAPPYKFFVGDDASIVPPAPPPDKVRVGIGVPDDPPARTSKLCVGLGDPVAVPKIFTLPCGGRLKF